MSFKSLSETLGQLFPFAPQAPSESPSPPPVRATRKQAQWRAHMAQAYSYLASQARGADAKEEVFQRYEQVMAEGADFLKVRSTAKTFGAVPCPAYSKAAAIEIMKQAERIEAESYKARAKCKHGGSLGRMAMQLLDWFLFKMWPRAKYGMFPSLAYIAEHALMSKKAVVQAMKRLELFGFLTIIRRRKLVMTEFGRKVVQDTNAYVLNLAQGLGALALSIFRKPSESPSVSAKETSSYNYTKQSVKPRSGTPNMGFWPSIKEAWETS